MDALIQYKHTKVVWNDSIQADFSSVPDYTTIRENAQSFYSALVSGWDYPCTEGHNVVLRLDPRIEDVTNGDENDERSMHSAFHVLL